MPTDPTGSGRSRRRRPSRAVAVVTGVLVATGSLLVPVAASADAPVPTVRAATRPTLRAAAVPAVYTPPARLPAGPPGTIVRDEDATVSGLHGSARLVKYKNK